MRRSHLSALLALSLTAGACLMTPTEDELVEDIERTTERKVRSAAGPWTGTSPVLTLDFWLHKGTGNAVSGTGTMKETTATGTVPITVTGTYQRPQLTLTFQGIVFEGRTVEGSFQGAYTSFIGITAPLRLTTTDYTRDIEVLLQEPGVD